MTSAITSPFTLPHTFLCSAGTNITPFSCQDHPLQSTFESTIFCTPLPVPTRSLEPSRISSLAMNIPKRLVSHNVFWLLPILDEDSFHVYILWCANLPRTQLEHHRVQKQRQSAHRQQCWWTLLLIWWRYSETIILHTGQEYQCLPSEAQPHWCKSCLYVGGDQGQYSGCKAMHCSWRAVAGYTGNHMELQVGNAMLVVNGVTTAGRMTFNIINQITFSNFSKPDA